MARPRRRRVPEGGSGHLKTQVRTQVAGANRGHSPDPRTRMTLRPAALVDRDGCIAPRRSGVRVSLAPWLNGPRSGGRCCLGNGEWHPKCHRQATQRQRPRTPGLISELSTNATTSASTTPAVLAGDLQLSGAARCDVAHLTAISLLGGDGRPTSRTWYDVSQASSRFTVVESDGPRLRRLR